MKRQLFYDPSSLNQLTPRETIILLAVKDNHSLDEIAQSLGIPQSLVTRHLSNIINKLSESDQDLVEELLFSFHIDRDY